MIIAKGKNHTQTNRKGKLEENIILSCNYTCKFKVKSYISDIQTCDSKQFKTLRLDYPDTYNEVPP